MIKDLIISDTCRYLYDFQCIHLNTYKPEQLKLFNFYICLIDLISAIACNLYICSLNFLLAVHLSLIVFELYIC